MATKIEEHVREGPKFTDYNGELDTPILVCTGCKHLHWYDMHYAYCQAQPIKGQTYPAHNAGTHLRQGAKPNKECPFPLNEKESECV